MLLRKPQMPSFYQILYTSFRIKVQKLFSCLFLGNEYVSQKQEMQFCYGELYFGMIMHKHYLMSVRDVFFFSFFFSTYISFYSFHSVSYLFNMHLLTAYHVPSTGVQRQQESALIDIQGVCNLLVGERLQLMRNYNIIIKEISKSEWSNQVRLF